MEWGKVWMCKSLEYIAISAAAPNRRRRITMYQVYPERKRSHSGIAGCVTGITSFSRSACAAQQTEIQLLCAFYYGLKGGTL